MKLRVLLILIIAAISIYPSLAQKPAKKITISGVVTDAAQRPISGAIILVDDKNTGYVTNRKGFYKIKVRSDAKLIKIFTMMNGVSEEPVDGRTTINFTFKVVVPSQNAVKATTENDESVHVGYGTTRKKELTTTVNKIDGQNKKYAGYKDIYEMLSYEVPGVTVSGQNINIQGASSFYFSTEPLFVVDGVIVSSIKDIPPFTVKSIEVLKGAAAGIYGSHGANGVIVITTLGAEK